jgi:hypothetical protein
MQSIRYFCPILTQIRMYPQILIRTRNIKFHKNMSGESHFFHPETYDGTSGHFLQLLCKHA